MKKKVTLVELDGLNRILSPVCAFLSGVILMASYVLYLRQAGPLTGFFIIMAIVMAELSHLAWQYSVRYKEVEVSRSL